MSLVSSCVMRPSRTPVGLEAQARALRRRPRLETAWFICSVLCGPCLCPGGWDTLSVTPQKPGSSGMLHGKNNKAMEWQLLVSSTLVTGPLLRRASYPIRGCKFWAFSKRYFQTAYLTVDGCARIMHMSPRAPILWESRDLFSNFSLLLISSRFPSTWLLLWMEVSGKGLDRSWGLLRELNIYDITCKC